jgi:hypothetical protein
VNRRFDPWYLQINMLARGEVKERQEGKCAEKAVKREERHEDGWRVKVEWIKEDGRRQWRRDVP